jgi:hypothetical protein
MSVRETAHHRLATTSGAAEAVGLERAETDWQRRDRESSRLERRSQLHSSSDVRRVVRLRRCNTPVIAHEVAPGDSGPDDSATTDSAQEDRWTFSAERLRRRPLLEHGREDQGEVRRNHPRPGQWHFGLVGPDRGWQESLGTRGAVGPRGEGELRWIWCRLLIDIHLGSNLLAVRTSEGGGQFVAGWRHLAVRKTSRSGAARFEFEIRFTGPVFGWIFRF